MSRNVPLLLLAQWTGGVWWPALPTQACGPPCRHRLRLTPRMRHYCQTPACACSLALLKYCDCAQAQRRPPLKAAGAGCSPTLAAGSSTAPKHEMNPESKALESKLSLNYPLRGSDCWVTRAGSKLIETRRAWNAAKIRKHSPCLSYA